MYIPGINRLDDLTAIYTFMQANDFAILVSNHEQRPVATHLPLTISRQEDEIKLQGHFAKANPQWQSLADQEALVIFSGPHAYISPTHYDKYESVPTWNYVAVHVYGTVELIRADEQSARLEAMLTTMINTYEPSYLAQWQNLSTRYRDGMKQGMIGFEILATRIEGKAKLSQNKNTQEQERIADALQQSANSSIIEVGYMMKNGLDTPSA